MIVYLIMFIIAEICVWFAVSDKSVQKNSTTISFKIGSRQFKYIPTKGSFAFLLSALPFIAVAALRFQVGTDYGTYVKRQIPEVMNGIYFRVEPLYRYVIKIGVSIGGYQWVFVLTHLLIIYFLWKHIRRYSLDARWSIFVFMFGALFNTSLNIMRQFVAVAICIYALKYVYEEKLVKYLFFILIACLFHTTGFVFLIFYFATKIHFPKWAPLIVTAICTMLSGVLRKLLVYFTSVTGIYSNYINDTRFDINDTQWDFILFEVLVSVVIILCMSVPKSGSAKNRSLTGVLNDKMLATQQSICSLMQLCTLVTAALSSIIPNSTRIILMFAIGQIIYIPLALENHKGKRSYYYVTAVIILLYLLMFFRFIINRNIGETLPYNFI